MILRVAAGLVLVLHGLVHGWFLALALGFVDLEPEMGWTPRSWLLSPLVSEDIVLGLAAMLYLVAMLGFVVGGLGVAGEVSRSQTVLATAAAISTIILVVTWNGHFDQLVEQGLVGVVINIAVLVWVFR
ncbi:MAG: hypothetical protein U5K37_08930 [Natrialbaceae archaeon]|nr:hypothetical protein [Natrialbaceae archaeon]